MGLCSIVLLKETAPPCFDLIASEEGTVHQFFSVSYWKGIALPVRGILPLKALKKKKTGTLYISKQEPRKIYYPSLGL